LRIGCRPKGVVNW